MCDLYRQDRFATLENTFEKSKEVKGLKQSTVIKLLKITVI